MAEEDGEKRAFQKQLERAVTVRLQHFKDQADSLTLESVRRLLEKDLGLANLALDAHKRFIRQYLEKIMDGPDESNPEPTTTNMDEGMVLSKEEETTLPKQPEAKSDKKSSTGNEETMEDSPIMGVLTPKPEVGSQSSLSESTIKKAILERADHLQANSDKISLAGVRRLLEEDLGLDKNTLDAFKIFISQQVDQVLSGAKNVKSVKKEGSEDVKSRKLKVSSEENSDNSESGSDEMKDKLKSRKEAAPRRTTKKLEQPKKRKISANDDIDVSHKKHNKLAKRQKEDNNADEDGSLSEDGQSQSSVERPAPKREKSATLAKSAPAYGKLVENLKSIIKACGMSIPPSIYKKAKQAPDDKRETTLVKELEGILLREGLSKNPSEKEIKDCRKRKDKARELEGIDMSNIISSSRRRSTFSFMAQEKPVVHAKKDKVDAKDSKKKESNNKDDNVGNKDKNEEKDEEKDKEKEKDEAEGEEEKDKENEEEVEQEEEDDGDDEEEDDEDESEEFDEDDNEESD